MALWEQLSALAARAEEVEHQAAAAKQKAKDDLEHDVEAAHKSAAAHGDKLKQKAAQSKDTASAGWDKIQSS
jgi:hypothetical protein